MVVIINSHTVIGLKNWMDNCKASLNIDAFSQALGYGNTQFYLQTSHACLHSPAAEHHCPLAGSHFITLQSRQVTTTTLHPFNGLFFQGQPG